MSNPAEKRPVTAAVAAYAATRAAPPISMRRGPPKTCRPADTAQKPVSDSKTPATRAIPVAFALEMLLPAALQPALTHVGPPHPVAFAGALVLAGAAAVLLGGSKAVAHAAAAAEPLTEP